MSPDSCVTMSHPLVLNELKKVFSTCNRCDPAVGAVAKIMEMVLNLAKYGPSRANLLNDSDFIDVCIDSVKKHIRKSDKDGVISTLTVLYILLKEEPTFDLKTTSIRNLILILKPMKKDFEKDGKKVTRKVYNFPPYWSAMKSGLEHFEKKDQAFAAVMGLIQKHATLTAKFKDLF